MNNFITNKGNAQLKTRLNIDIADIDRLWGKIQSGVKLSIRVSGTVKDMPLAICFMPERKNV
jgi:autotransporter translocation and assembly factor TamB